MSDVSVVVGTFGEQKWAELAQERAVPSALWLDVPAIHAHGETLAEARNSGLEQVETEWVIHLDADDELEEGYVEAMEGGSADVRAPAVRLMRPGRTRGRIWIPKVFAHDHLCRRDCLPFGNWICVGAYARTELLRSVGGWEEWPIYEDWALWLRCYAAGARFEYRTDAIYRQHLSPESRNHSGEAFSERNSWHNRIVTEILGGVPA